MTQENLIKAIEIIQGGHNAKITLNYVPSGGSVSNAKPLVLHESNATTVKRLVEEGYSLFPESYGILIDKF